MQILLEEQGRSVCNFKIISYFGSINITDLLVVLQVKKMMEDGIFVAFCNFLADLFEAINKFSFLLYVILPQVRLK